MLKKRIHELAMNILIICKRRPQGKDLWERPNGRFYHLAKYLAEYGHCVDFLLVSYKRNENFSEKREGIKWYSVSALPDPSYVYRYAATIADKKSSDWIVGVSDTYFGILASTLASRRKCFCLVDAYDNYESYIPWLKPLHWCWRHALKQADAISAPGHCLLDKMADNGSVNDGRELMVLPMAADEAFRPLDKLQCRKQLDLPAGKKLIGYCGSLHYSRDITALFKLADMLAEEDSECLVVVTGGKQNNIRVPDNILYLGYLDDALMPVMFNALDVQLVFNKRGQFGDYSYPVKIYEALACHVPVLASRTPSVAEVLGHDSNRLFEPGDIRGLVLKIRALLAGNAHQPVDQRAGWREIVLELSRFLASGQVTEKILD